MLNLNTKEYTEKLTKAPIYRKAVGVWVVQKEGTDGEEEIIKTVLKSGKLETVNKVKVGDFIVTNPDGERYVVKEDTFNSKYDFTGETRVTKIDDKDVKQKFYIPKESGKSGRVKAMKNDTDSEVTIVAPWGEEQYGDADCYFVCLLDENENLTEDRYLIGNTEFNNTYVEV